MSQRALRYFPSSKHPLDRRNPGTPAGILAAEATATVSKGHPRKKPLRFRSPVPKRQPLDTLPMRNSAGGFSWKVNLWQQLDRFLLLGTEGGTHYIRERELTAVNAGNVLKCIAADGSRVVRRVTEISEAGRAKDNDPAIFALALCTAAQDFEVRSEALAALPRVCRMGTHLLHFASFVSQFRGWGLALRRAVANWYLERDIESLAYQLIKYQQRDEWSQRDLIRLAHPKPKTPAQEQVLRWAAGRLESADSLPEEASQLAAFERLHGLAHANQEDASLMDEAAQIIRRYRLPREAVPTPMLRDARIWDALLPHMPLGALVRNLGNLSKCGLLTVGRSTVISAVCERLTSSSALRGARLHPMALLAALLTYKNGRGTKGKGTWPVVPEVVAALEEAFYKSFEAVEPTGARYLLGVDVSGSMGDVDVCGVPKLTPRLASACLAMTLVRTEAHVTAMGFDFLFSPLDINPGTTLPEVEKMMNNFGFANTDCSLPMQWALENELPVDVFVVLTDSETWDVGELPAEALRRYRAAMGIDAKLVVVAMVANEFTIADPNDLGMLDVVGMDTHVPLLISEFAKMPM